MTELLPTYIRANMLDEAGTLGKRLLKVSETLYGSDGMVTLHVLFYLSAVYERSGQLESSRDTRMQVLASERKILSQGHKKTFFTMTELAISHYRLGIIGDAIAWQLEALDGYRQSDGDNAVNIMQTVFDLACSYHKATKLEEARLNYEDAISMSRSLLGDQDEKTITKLAPLMVLYTELDEYELAKNLAYETLWFMEQAHGDDDSLTQEARRNVVTMTIRLKNWRDAEGQAEKLLASLERTHGMDHADTIDMTDRLAKCLKVQREFTAAEPLYAYSNTNASTSPRTMTSPSKSWSPSFSFCEHVVNSPKPPPSTKNSSTSTPALLDPPTPQRLQQPPTKPISSTPKNIILKPQPSNSIS